LAQHALLDESGRRVGVLRTLVPGERVEPDAVCPVAREGAVDDQLQRAASEAPAPFVDDDPPDLDRAVLAADVLQQREAGRLFVNDDQQVLLVVASERLAMPLA